MNRTLLVSSFVAAMAVGVRAQAPAEEPRVVAPRTADDPALAPALREMQEMIAKGADGAALMAAPSLQPLREVTVFRRAVEERAPKGEATIAPEGEPGTPLVVRGAFTDLAGKPIEGAVLYAYHTSAKGWYADRAPHYTSNGGSGGDVGHARLFAYVRTDATGRFVLRTIRPGGYPRSTLPEHVHWHLSIAGKAVAGGELWFDDDARLTAAMRERAGRDVVIAKPEKDGAGLVVEPTFVVDVPKVTPKK